MPHRGWLLSGPPFDRLVAEWRQVFALELALIAVTVYGFATFFSVLKRGYFLDVRSTSGRKRLAFAGRPVPSDLEQFVQLLEVELEQKIDRPPVRL